jgi:hypothetical protein
MVGPRRGLPTLGAENNRDNQGKVLCGSAAGQGGKTMCSAPEKRRRIEGWAQACRDRRESGPCFATWKPLATRHA